MVLKQDQQRVKTLLTDAIVSTLSRNGLLYKSEFCIEGLLGVTLDNHDVFLINIKETIRSANLTGCSPPSKDPSLAPLDLMVFNSLGPGLGDVQTTHGEDLTMKNASLTSTPGKKSSSFCPYLDTGADMCVKGDTSFNFALNYADYDVIEDLSRAGCGKRIQNLTMDDLSMLDNDMGIIMEKDVLPTVSTVPPLERKCADKVSTMKAAGLGKDFDTENQAETLDLSVQEDDVLPTITSKPATPETEEGMPLNLSEPKKKKTNKKKFECSSCHKFYKSEASLSKHKCKATSESTQPLDLTVNPNNVDRLEDGPLIIVVPDTNPDSQTSTAADTADTTTTGLDTTTATVDATNTDLDTTNTALGTANTSEDTAEDIITASPLQQIAIVDSNNVTNNVEEEEESFTCICGRTLPDYLGYMNHTTHCAKAKLTPYKTCEICLKAFFSNSGYVKHKRLHVGAYKLRCHVCQKGFFDKTHLKAHIDSSHSKVPGYECNHCNKGFFYKHHLKRHTCRGLNKKTSKQSRETTPDTTKMDVDSSQFDDSTTLECQWTCNIKAS